MKLTLFLVVAVSLSGTSQSQSTLTWIHPIEDPGLTHVMPIGVQAHPSGGSVAAFTRVTGDLPRLLVRRLSENGVVLWTSELSAPVGTHVSATFGPMYVTARGSTVVAVPQPGLDPRLLSIDAAGQMEWNIPLDSSIAAAPFRLAGLGGTSAGDVLVGAVQDDLNLPIFSGSATVRSFRGDTGAERWRHESPALGAQLNRALFAVREDRAFLVYWGVTGVEAHALSGAGNLLYSTTGLQPGNVDPVASFIEPGPSGTLAFGHWTAYASQAPNVVVLDAAGAVSWTRPVQSTWGISDASWTTNGDLVLLEGGSLGKTLTRFGPSGALAWRHSGPVGTRSYTAVVAGLSDDVVVTSYQESPVFPYVHAKLEFVDAMGTTVGEQYLNAPSGIYAEVSPASRDGRGNLLVAMNRYAGFEATSGAVAAVVPGGNPSVVTCSQTTPNSTGLTSTLYVAGSARALEDRLTLVADQVPEGAWVLFLNGRMSAFVPHPNGSLGDLCLGGTVGRYIRPGQIQQVSALGTASLQLDLPLTPSGGGSVAIIAGETWYFQAWHRDVASGLNTSNFTDAVSVTFL